MSGGPHPGGELDAGPIARWAEELTRAVADGATTDVPCGTCTACCTSSQFVLIGPDEVDTLAHVPAELRFPAPGAPRGWVLLPYDEHGRCPMLGDSGCSIYEHRPRTCRTYDCRVFAATGIEPDAGQPAIAERVRRWRFSTKGSADEAAQRAVHDAAVFLTTHVQELAGAGLPPTPTQRAVLAVELRGHFTGEDDPAVAEIAVEVRRRFARPGGR